MSDPYANFEPCLEYPPANDLRDTLSDLAELVVVTEQPDERVLVDLLREQGDEEWRVRFDVSSLEVAWESMARMRIQAQAIFKGQETARGIEYVPSWRR